MGAALGFILGTGIRALGEHGALKRQQSMMQQETANKALEDMLKSNPVAASAFLSGPEGQKVGKKLWGEQADAMTMMFGAAAKTKQAEEAQFSQLTGGAQSAGSATPMAGQPKQPQTPEDWAAYEQKLIQARPHFTDPAHLKALDDEIQMARQQGQNAQHRQEYQQTQQRLEQQHQDTETDKAMTRAMMAQNEEFNRWFKSQTLEEKKQRDTEASQQKTETQFNQHVTSLQAHKLSLMNNLQGKLAAGTLDAKTAQPIVDAYNRNVDQMEKAAKQLGVDFSPDDYRISITPGEKGYFGTAIGATKPSVQEGGTDALIGQKTSKPDGTYNLKGKRYIVKGGVIAGLDQGG